MEMPTVSMTPAREASGIEPINGAAIRVKSDNATAYANCTDTNDDDDDAHNCTDTNAHRIYTDFFGQYRDTDTNMSARSQAQT